MSQILLVIIAVFIVVLVLNLFGGFSHPDLLVSMHPVTKPLVHNNLIFQVDIFNIGSDTANGCDIYWLPYGFTMPSEKVKTWGQKLDYASWLGAFIHFPYLYNKTGTFDTILQVKCDNYVSQDIHYTLNVN